MPNERFDAQKHAHRNLGKMKALIVFLLLSACSTARRATENVVIRLRSPPNWITTTTWLWYYTSVTEETCFKYNLYREQCFAVFRFLLVTYPIGERGAVTRFYHEATAATDYKRGNVAYLRPKLNITPFEFHNTLPNVDKGQSPGEINLIPDATPLTCFSKTLLFPDPPVTYHHIDMAKVAFEKHDFGPLGLLPERVKRLCRDLGVNHGQCNRVLERCRKYANGTASQWLSIGVNRTIWIDGVGVNPEENPLVEVAHTLGCGMPVRDGRVSGVCLRAFENVIKAYSDALELQLLRCKGVSLQRIKTGAPPEIQFQTQTDLSMPSCSREDGAFEDDAVLLPLDLWNLAFDKSLFRSFTKCSIKYMTPTSFDKFIDDFPEQDIMLSYASVLRHPITGVYMLYYSVKDLRTRNDRNAYLGNDIVKLLYSDDGISFSPLQSTVFAGFETNIVFYNSQDSSGQNFSPMVDYSNCPVGATNVYDMNRLPLLDESEEDTQEYLQGDHELLKRFPRRHAYSFKGIGGEHRPDAEGIDVGLHSFRSGDGINWKSYGDAYSRKAILNASHLLESPYTRTYFDSRSDLLYDHEERVFKVFARHNVKRGVRGIQMLRSHSECEWRRYSQRSGTAVKVQSGLGLPYVQFYTASANIFPGTKYIAFFPSAHFSGHSNCPTFVTFMYSSDGGDNAHHDVLSVLNPRRTRSHRMFENCKLSSEVGPTVFYQVMDVRGIVESKDCEHLYIYTMHSDKNPPLWNPRVIKVHRFRYGGIAAVESENWSDTNEQENGVGFVETRVLLVPRRAARLILNYESQEGGHVRVGVVIATEGRTCASSMAGVFAWSHKVNGNELAKELTWAEGSEKAPFVSQLAGRRVIIRFELVRARLFGFMFSHSEATHKHTMNERGNFCAQKFK